MWYQEDHFLMTNCKYIHVEKYVIDISFSNTYANSFQISNLPSNHENTLWYWDWKYENSTLKICLESQCTL